jgi:hypothetical protein
VVEDWKKHEEEKFDAMSKLEAQHENDTKFQQRQQEILAHFEKDVSLAAEALSQEQERAANAEREKGSQVSCEYYMYTCLPTNFLPAMLLDNTACMYLKHF